MNASVFVLKLKA